MKIFKEIFPTGRAEPRLPPEVYKAVSDAIQACQLGGADPAQQAAEASQDIDAYLASYSGGPAKVKASLPAKRLKILAQGFSQLQPWVSAGFCRVAVKRF